MGKDFVTNHLEFDRSDSESDSSDSDQEFDGLAARGCLRFFDREALAKACFLGVSDDADNPSIQAREGAEVALRHPVLARGMVQRREIDLSDIDLDVENAQDLGRGLLALFELAQRDRGNAGEAPRRASTRCYIKSIKLKINGCVLRFSKTSDAFRSVNNIAVSV